jgi:exopolysaccharide production protein ExoQ
MKKHLPLLEKIFSIFALVHLSGGPLLNLLSGGASEGDGSDHAGSLPLVIATHLTVYGISFILLVLRWKKVVPLVIKGWPICLFTGLIILSNLWSYTPPATLNRSILFTGTTFFAFYLATRYSVKEQLQFLGWVMFVIIVASFAMIVALPHFGIMAGTHMGAWRGIYVHKNGFGPLMALSTVSFFLLAQTPFKTFKNPWPFLVMCAISVICLALAKSSSAVVALVIMGGALIFLPILRLSYGLMVPVLSAVSLFGIMTYILFSANSAALFEILGKDATLTGRTDLWLYVIDKIQENPWLGYGYGAFWQGFDGPSAYVWLAQPFSAVHPHNGYLELMIDVGLIGFAIYAFVFLIGLQRAFSYARNITTADGLWPAVYLIFILAVNSAESGLVQDSTFNYVVQTSLFLSLNLPVEDEMAKYWYEVETYEKVETDIS